MLKDISLDFAPNGVTAIIGPSGTGKSTLIRCVNRLVDPTAGEILFEGQDLAKLKGKSLRLARRRIGMVFQEYNLVERLSVIENVLSAAWATCRPGAPSCAAFPDADVARAFELLDAVGLGEAFATRRADALSGGQRQRVGIARAIMQDPRPHPRGRADLLAGPQDLRRDHGIDGRALGRARHPGRREHSQRRSGPALRGRVIGMTGGRVVYDGPPDGLERRHLTEIYGGEAWQ